jgi:hypothetical protein
MLKLTARPQSATSLWFVIPEELQRATALMLQSKLEDIANHDARANAERVLFESVNYQEKYSESIWEAHGICFYTNYGIWRVGAGQVPPGFTKENILAEIKEFDAIEVEARVVTDPLLLK